MRTDLLIRISEFYVYQFDICNTRHFFSKSNYKNYFEISFKTCFKYLNNNKGISYDLLKKKILKSRLISYKKKSRSLLSKVRHLVIRVFRNLSNTKYTP